MYFLFGVTTLLYHLTITKRQGDTFPPSVQGQKKFAFAFMDGEAEFMLFDVFSGKEACK